MGKKQKDTETKESLTGWEKKWEDIKQEEIKENNQRNEERLKRPTPSKVSYEKKQNAERDENGYEWVNIYNGYTGQFDRAERRKI